MEKTVEIQLQELREQIAQAIEKQPCFCTVAANEFESDSTCWRCASAEIARGE
jgi:hypothetical protein